MTIGRTDLLRRAGEKGSGGAAAMLGAGYRRLGRAEDEQEALRWFRVAAALSEPEAWLGLGRMYERTGVAQDGLEAAVWYALAANAGRPEAQTAMGDAARLGELGQRRDKAAAAGTASRPNRIPIPPGASPRWPRPGRGCRWILLRR